MTARIDDITALLHEAEGAHGIYETTELNGVYDQDWARWYAGYAVDHGLGALLGRDVTADEVATLLASAYADFQGAEPTPTETWATYVARRLASA